MNKNPTGEKPHKDQRDQVLTQLENYDWEADHLKIAKIKEAADILPDSNFEVPNYIAIKTAMTRTLSLIETLVQSHEYGRCDELQKLIKRTEDLLKQYVLMEILL